MATKLIQLEGGMLVEIVVPDDQGQRISSNFADKINKAFDSTVSPVLKNVCQSISNAWSEMNQYMLVEQAEVEIGLSFEAEGNLYITSAKAGANLTLKLTLKPAKTN